MTINSDSELDSTPDERTTKQRKNVRRALVALAIIIVLLITTAIGAGLWLRHKFSQIETFKDPFQEVSKIEGIQRPDNTTTENKQPVNFLILGTDSRISAGNPAQWKAGAQRTDAIMIAQIDGSRSSINVLSIPRDAWVSIPGHGEAKINAAFSIGGLPLTIATVEQLTGIRIQHAAIMDFNSFVSLTDAVGGVELNSVTEGKKHYNGKQALAFVRERKHLPGGDFDRVRRQQTWMKAVISQTLTKETLSSPTKLLELFNSLSPYVAIDENLNFTTLASLAAELRNLRSNDVHFITAPHAGTGRSADGQSIVNLDRANFDEMVKAFAEDKALMYIHQNAGKLKTLESTPVN
ncbi:LCP family protein required for cell wall assembly [Arcanobacterium pluranimalium]|uniref:LCP family protein n=1 Tax=Arcanobacterium pluranimalium TaxID=108028 RepID=UPI00195E7541|nr:LCP family protein [Arcanobacterium pluranimalium]MBM7824603.1 LCP family protein required for cell wall assembly [Arcanobacterium pluranimalium]